MSIKENQVKELQNLIQEGISCQTAALQGKKAYLKKVQDWIGQCCLDNKENVPDWVYVMTVPTININSSSSDINPSYYDKKLASVIQLLQELLEKYHIQEKLEESKTQICYMRLSLLLALLGIIASVLVPIFVTNTIKIEEKQYQEIKTVFEKQDSLTFIDPNFINNSKKQE